MSEPGLQNQSYKALQRTSRRAFNFMWNIENHREKVVDPSFHAYIEFGSFSIQVFNRLIDDIGDFFTLSIFKKTSTVASKEETTTTKRHR